MSLVEYEVRGAIGVIAVNNPPVNALSIGVPRQIIESLAAGNADTRVTAFVLCGKGRGFVAGADIREFGKPRPEGEPDLRDTIAAIEASPKPVVAAIHGNALGGGLELAMGCHYRVAAADASLGQPEVKLGIPPGAGGTQRLPRLIGFEKALDMIVDGTPIRASEGHGLGLIDEIVHGDLGAGAAHFAEHAAAARSVHPRARESAAKPKDPMLFERKRESIARRAGARRAPYACIDCVEAAALPFHEGIARERAIFEECVASSEAAAMRHVFFAERAAGRVPGLEKDAARAIETAAVIGGGTMGRGIAIAFADTNIPILLMDADEDALQRAQAAVARSYAAAVAKGRLGQAEADRRAGLISYTLRPEDAGDADLVIEAVFEDLPLKKKTFRRLDGLCKPDAILASNTSYLDIDAMAAETGRPERVLGMHFFSPANVMRLLEVVRTATCSDETLATVMALAKRLRKVAVVSGVCDGFIANRMAVGYRREAWFLLEEGALPHQVDRVMTEFGMAMGPFAASDLAGLDIGWRKRKADEATRDKTLRYSPVADRLCEAGRFGQKTGAGFYRYQAGSRAPQRDEAVERLIAALSRELGIERRSIDDAEILARCLLPIINEGARILEEGIALRASDIDIAWVAGMGFPDYRGGPMFHADTMGPADVYDAVRRHHEQTGDVRWQPAARLRDLAEGGGRFGEQ